MKLDKLHFPLSLSKLSQVQKNWGLLPLALLPLLKKSNVSFCPNSLPLPPKQVARSLFSIGCVTCAPLKVPIRQSSFSLHRLLPFTPFFSDFLFTPSTYSCFPFSCLPAPLKLPLRRGLSLLRSSPPMNLLHWLCCMWHVSLMACLGRTCHSHPPPHTHTCSTCSRFDIFHLQQIYSLWQGFLTFTVSLDVSLASVFFASDSGELKKYSPLSFLSFTSKPAVCVSAFLL